MKKSFLFIIVAVGILAGVTFLAFSHKGAPVSNKLQVVTSFYPMYFFSKEIGGDKATVINITPADAEPHDYEPSTQDVANITKSNLLVMNGNVEPWADKIKDQLKDSSTYIVTASQGLVNRTIDEDGQTITDPHVWQDPLLAKKQVAVIERAFEAVDPSNAAYYQANADKLEGQLDELNSEYASGLNSCQLKDFVTSHAAFGYMAAQYGINQVSISGVSPDEEPSSQKLAEVADLVKREHIDVIFFESLVSPKLSQTIAQETGAKAMVLDPLEGIPADQAAKGADYFSIMRQNLANLQIALQCE